MSDISGETLAAGDSGYVTRIRSQYALLSKQQKKVADYILAHPDSGLYLPITLLAKKPDISTATISRFCQVLSCRGFNEMKLYMNKRTLSPSAESDLVENSDSLSVVLQKLALSTYDAINDTIQILDPAIVSSVVDGSLSANIINLYGQNGGYISGLHTKQLLLRVGVLSQAVNGSVDMQLTVSILKAGDIAIGIVYSDEVRSVVRAMEVASKNGVTVATVTTIPNSNMAKFVDYTLRYNPDIPDDLCCLHLRNICEVNILGAVQTEILRRPSQNKYTSGCRGVILKSRRRVK